MKCKYCKSETIDAFGVCFDCHRNGPCGSLSNPKQPPTKNPEDKQLCTIKQVKWGGEGLPPIGVECEMIFDGKVKLITPLYFTDFVDGLVLFYHSSNSMTHCDDTYDWCLVENCIFRKPETPEAKKEREELEAAYDLYCDYCKGTNFTSVDFSLFDNPSDNRAVWLAIVRKAGYRKEAR